MSNLVSYNFSIGTWSDDGLIIEQRTEHKSIAAQTAKLEIYINDGYKDFPEYLWEDSKLDNEPILRMLYRIGMFLNEPMIYIIVYTKRG